jgi:hypothetical protein
MGEAMINFVIKDENNGVVIDDLHGEFSFSTYESALAVLTTSGILPVGEFYIAVRVTADIG